MEVVLNPDATDDGADWIKRGTWDIPAETVDELREWLMGQHITVEHFKTGQAYLSNVESMPWLLAL